MKYIKVSKDAPAPTFHGIKIEREYLDGSLSKVKISFEDDTHFVVGKSGWSDMELYIPAPKVLVKKYVAKGMYRNSPVEVQFDDKYDAEKFSASLEGLEVIEVEVAQPDLT